MAVDLTYVALKPLRVRGERREAGELVPEATQWRRVDAWINQGKVAPVPRASVDQAELKAAEDAMNAASAGSEDGAEGSADNDPSSPGSGGEPGGGGDSEIDEELESEIEEFSVGGGWYEIPGADKKLRRDAAIEYLTSLEDDEE